MTEKSLFTELIMFENSRINSNTLIFPTNAFPFKLYGFQLYCNKESKLWKRFFSETRRELPFGFEPKPCWLKVNRSIHLSYGSISRFIFWFSVGSEKIFIWEPRNSEIADAGVEPTISRSWLLRGIPFHSSANAVWRIRTYKSFPTDWLATSSNTIMGIRHVMAQFLDTQFTNSTLRLPEGVVPSKWSWWSEIRTLQTYRNRFTVGLLFQLHIHQCQKCVFTELSLLIKQVPWFFMCIPITALTFGYSLWLSISPQRYWVDFHL